jgi:hypothetical protein
MNTVGLGKMSRYDTMICAILPQSMRTFRGEDTIKDGSEKVIMNGMKAAEQSQDSKRQTSQRSPSDLDRRYGKIGISAVAAAVRQQDHRPASVAARSFLYDRD